MRSVNNEKNGALSKLHRRNKITITILTSLIISLILIIGTLITYLVQEDNNSLSGKLLSSNNHHLLFYTAPCNFPPCWRVYDTIITTTYISDPARIFTLTLQTSIGDLENLVSLIASSRKLDDEPQQIKMRTLLINYSGQIQSIFQFNPYMLGVQSDEHRGEMIKRFINAEEDLEACVRDLEKADESTAAIEVKEKVLRVKGYLSSSRDNLFTYEHDVVWDKFWGEFVAKLGVIYVWRCVSHVCGWVAIVVHVFLV